MHFKFNLVVFLCLATLMFIQTSAIAQSADQVDRINNYWKNLDKNYPNLHKIPKVGKIQDVGEIQVPKGIQAIKTSDAPCSHRFSVNADTLFEFDKSTLTNDAEDTLRLLIPMIAKLGSHPIKVEGHTDSIGSDEYNQELSEKRAQRVKNWLLENHVVPPHAVSIEGFGERKPIAPNKKADGSDNPQGRALNRRVEIVVDTCKTIDSSN